ncbi:MAG: hypothetical protein Q7U73_05025 [Rubrivivax sp.]|nr:hypothetical protein [Rubrivivax sp.]
MNPPRRLQPRVALPPWIPVRLRQPLQLGGLDLKPGAELRLPADLAATLVSASRAQLLRATDGHLLLR